MSENTSMGRQAGKVIKAALVFLLIITGVYFVACYYAVWKVTRVPPGSPLEPTPADYGLKYENIHFPARNDGLEIAGWFIPKAKSRYVIILVHGRYENRATAMDGQFPKLAAALNKAGYAVLMIDLRGHGESAPARFDFGIKAKNDVLGAVDWLVEKGYRPGTIGALGVSMGGGAVSYAAAEEPSIGAVVLDSAYADFSLIETLWNQETGLPRYMVTGTYLIYRVMFGSDLRDLAPIDKITSTQPRPFLILHCREDQSVPIQQGERLAENIPGAQRWFVDSTCEHAQIYPAMPQAYEDRVISFFLNNLPE